MKLYETYCAQRCSIQWATLSSPRSYPTSTRHSGRGSEACAAGSTAIATGGLRAGCLASAKNAMKTSSEKQHQNVCTAGQVRLPAKLRQPLQSRPTYLPLHYKIRFRQVAVAGPNFHSDRPVRVAHSAPYKQCMAWRISYMLPNGIHCFRMRRYFFLPFAYATCRHADMQRLTLCNTLVDITGSWHCEHTSVPQMPLELYGTVNV
jgi:hypothetical protein